MFLLLGADESLPLRVPRAGITEPASRPPRRDSRRPDVVWLTTTGVPTALRDDQRPRTTGGGLGLYEPGEYSDVDCAEACGPAPGDRHPGP
ncbi:hypothetical protein GCM10010510_48630 [Streptomyces anandii JCM 4720]|nr:hypothetical protein GCM10010510_48630 [Streptomyces anandii JCM 4720]